MSESRGRAIDTVVIGAGQAGPIMSWHLQRAGRDHVVLDRRDTLGGGWQDRWDGFQLVTTGYAPDYGWLDLPILDEFGVPRHVRGVSEVPGLSFLGLLWQRDNASANLAGVARDAADLASSW